MHCGLSSIWHKGRGGGRPAMCRRDTSFMDYSSQGYREKRERRCGEGGKCKVGIPEVLCIICSEEEKKFPLSVSPLISLLFYLFFYFLKLCSSTATSLVT